jgi:GTP-binding protein YchF
MQLGIIGLPASGKTTIFNALTQSELPTGELMGGERIEVHAAVVEVPDARLASVAEIFQPKRTTPARVTYADIAGLGVQRGAEGLPGPLINQLEQTDGLLVVLRAFEDENVPHPLGAVSPERDWQILNEELILHDLLMVERRRAKLEEEWGKGARDRAEIEREQRLFDRMAEVLEEGKPLRTASWSQEDQAQIQGFGWISRLPMLTVLNLGEGQEAAEVSLPVDHPKPLAIHGKLEMEIAQLPDDEQALFIEEYDLGGLSRDRVIEASYDVLGLLTFFTGNDQEVRAWTLRRGETALDAAGTVHSDLARGFIRAEVIPWSELVELGGLTQARSAGRLNAQGKEYIVQDGDVIYVRFNV